MLGQGAEACGTDTQPSYVGNSLQHLMRVIIALKNNGIDIHSLLLCEPDTNQIISIVFVVPDIGVGSCFLL
jgi:acetolactate synthase small subunit